MLKRHLIYHVTPIGNFQWNLEQLEKRIDLFDGERIIAVAQGKLQDGSEIMPIAKLRGYLPLRCTILSVPNHPILRETASLPSLLTTLHAALNGQGGITFYGHTKGATRQEEPFKFREAVRLWTEIMYGQLLDNIQTVEAQLASHPCTGCFKRYGRFGHFPKNSHWHYSGTFFWFRNADLFARAWREVPPVRYGAEAYLSTIFSAEESACIFGEGVTNLYDLNYLRRVMAVRDGNIRSLQKRLGAGANDNMEVSDVQANRAKQRS